MMLIVEPISCKIKPWIFFMEGFEKLCVIHTTLKFMNEVE